MASGLHFIVLLCLSCGLWIGEIGEAKPSDADCCVYDCCKTCPEGWTWFGDYCYKFNFSELDWADAEVACIAAGGNLASIHTKDHYDFVKGLIKTSAGSDKQTWVGGTNAVKEAVWLWTDGSKFENKLWEPRQPSKGHGVEHCLVLNYLGKMIICCDFNFALMF
uniref:C-type lectin domain-containing protein n=1 Tax=Monopterus albus TaxID=43700 RepID=A0A3Q3QX77_MONAL